MFKTLISPLCDQIFYCYYGDEDADSDDIKEWEILEDLDENIESANIGFRILSRLFLSGLERIWNGRLLFLFVNFLQVELWRSRCEKKKKSGSILVFVLALIVLLSVLCMRLMEETMQELRHVSQFHRRDDLRMHAYSALDVAVGVLNEFMMFEKTLYAPSQGWGDPLAYSEIEPIDPSIKWSISLVDESGKIPISKVSEKDLVSLFATMRAEGDSLIDDDDGQAFYDAMVDWQDPDDEERDEGAEDDYYEGLDFPYFTPGKKRFKILKNLE